MKTVLLFLVLGPVISWAQMYKITPDDTYRKHSYLLMRDGSVVRGRIVRQDSSVITVRKRKGEMTFIEADQILRVSPDRPNGVSKIEDSSPFQTVFVFRDGTQVEGTYIRRDSTMITVRKRNGQLTYFEPELLIRVDTIRAALASADSDSQSFANRFSPWLLTGQTAHTAEKGRFYYRNTLFLQNEFDYGITRNWSVGASFVTPVPYLVLTDYYAFRGFLPRNTQLFSKLSVPIGDQFRLGLHVTYKDNLLTNYLKRGALTFQALASVGTSQRNVTIGYGLINRGTYRYFQYITGYSSSSMYPASMAIPVDVPIPDQSFLTVGIMQKVSPMLTLVSDNRINLGKTNYYYDESGERASISFALRIDRRRHAFDLGFYSLLYRNDFKWDGHLVRILPYIGYNLIIGRD